MLHAKLQDNRTSCSGEEEFGVYSIYGHGGHLGLVAWTIYINVRSSFPRKLHMKLVKRFQRRRCLNIVADNDGRRSMTAHVSLRMSTKWPTLHPCICYVMGGSRRGNRGSGPLPLDFLGYGF